MKYDLPTNIITWIACALFNLSFEHLLPLDEPFLSFLFGAILGIMLMWAQEIFREWINQKIKEDDNDNSN